MFVAQNWKTGRPVNLTAWHVDLKLVSAKPYHPSICPDLPEPWDFAEARDASSQEAQALLEQ